MTNEAINSLEPKPVTTAHVTLYRKIVRDGRELIVHRTFNVTKDAVGRPLESLPDAADGWVDSPTKLGAPESAPQLKLEGPDAFDDVALDLGPAESPVAVESAGGKKGK